MPLTAAQGEQLQAGLQRELMRLLKGEDHEASWHRLGAVPMLSAPAIDIPAAVRPTELGHQIARSVFASLNQTS
jgi:hypothetical protein